MSWLHIASAVAAVTSATIAPEPPSRLPEPTDAEQLRLQTERNERVTVPVTIKGQGPFRFLVDTGAQATVVSSALADRLDLTERSPAILVGMASREEVATTAIPELSLGGRKFLIPSAPIVDAENLGGADGILGLDSLQNQRVLLDFDLQRIFVSDGKAMSGSGGYEIVVKARRRLGQLIITNAQLNGIDTSVIIDTGSQGSVGNLALLGRLRRSKALGDGTMTDINGNDLTASVKVARELVIDHMIMGSLPIMFADAPPFGALGLTGKPALILGITDLKVFRRVAIDFSRQQVMFDVPKATRRQLTDIRPASS